MADPIVNIGDLPLEWLTAGSRFEVGLGQIGGSLGLRGLGTTLHLVPAGKTAWPFHRHHGQDEMFLVLSAGGEAHQIINSSDAELRYIAFSNHTRVEVIEHPDSGKVALDTVHGNDKEPPSTFGIEGRITPMKYWDGEDIGGQSR